MGVFGCPRPDGCRSVPGGGFGSDMELVAALDLGDERTPAEAAEVIVDFTHPDAVMDNLSWYRPWHPRRRRYRLHGRAVGSYAPPLPIMTASTS